MGKPRGKLNIIEKFRSVSSFRILKFHDPSKLLDGHIIINAITDKLDFVGLPLSCVVEPLRGVVTLEEAWGQFSREVAARVEDCAEMSPQPFYIRCQIPRVAICLSFEFFQRLDVDFFGNNIYDQNYMMLCPALCLYAAPVSV